MSRLLFFSLVSSCACVFGQDFSYLKAHEFGYDWFGYSVAMEGSTSVIGAPLFTTRVPRSPEAPNGEVGNSGGVFVFDRSIQGAGARTYLANPEPFSNDQFGWSVAISGDTLVVGARGDQATGINAGAVFVFQRGDEGWRFQQRLFSPNPDEFDRFGEIVAISGDSLAVSAPDEDGSRESTLEAPDNDSLGAGAVYLYSRTEGIRSLDAYLKEPSESRSGSFASSVAIDGDFLCVGAPLDRYNPGNVTNVSGSVHVYKREGRSWVPIQRLHSTTRFWNGDQVGFGTSLAMKGDVLVIGNPQEPGASWSTPNHYNFQPLTSGSVYVFERLGDEWHPSGFLKATEAGRGDDFGRAVATDGTHIVVGARNEDGTASSTFANVDRSGDRVGAAYLYSKVGGVWSPRAYLKAFNAGQADRFGTSVAVSDEIIVVGAPEEDGTFNPGNALEGTGAAYSFSVDEEIGRTEMASQADFENAVAHLPMEQRTQDAIPFDDGTSNFVKYAFNMDLKGIDHSVLQPGSDHGLPWGRYERGGGTGHFVFEYVRRRNRGLVYIPMVSLSLEEGSFAIFEGERQVTPVNDDWERVTLWDVPDGTGPATKRFMKVRVIGF